MQTIPAAHTTEIYTGFLTLATLLLKISYDAYRDHSRRVDEDRKRQWDIDDRARLARESADRANMISQKIDDNTQVSAAAMSAANVAVAVLAKDKL